MVWHAAVTDVAACCLWHDKGNRGWSMHHKVAGNGVDVAGATFVTICTSGLTAI